MIQILIYLILAAALLVLAVLSRNEKTLSEEPSAGFRRILRKMSVYLYRKSLQWKKKLTGKKYSGSPGAEIIRKELTVLKSSVRIRTEEARYFVDKIQIFLVFLLAADALAVSVWFAGRQEPLISSEGIVKRPAYEQPAREITATVSTKDDEGKKISIGEYELKIDGQTYTEREADRLSEELMNQLPKLIRGENRNLNYVTENLNLISSAEGYPFRISWESSDYSLVDTDGTVHAGQLRSGEHGKVQLTATLFYEGRKNSRSYDALVFRKPESQEEKLDEGIRRELEEEESRTRSESVLRLPSYVNGVSLQWEEKKEDQSLLLFILIAAAGVLAYAGKDQELHKKVQDRDRELALDYPLILSKLTLYLGAGMSMRNIFCRLGEEYQKKREEGGEKRYVYEEILLVCRELDNGISEAAAYTNFGKRCRSGHYSKLSTLLISNLKKGNSELLKALQEEADRSFEERRSIARQMGEEAGTKLLLPMMIMLGVTLVIIMIPAYFSFSL